MLGIVVYERSEKSFVARASWQRLGVVLTLAALVLSGDGYSGPGDNSSVSEDIFVSRILGEEQFDGLVALLWDPEVESLVTSMLPALALWTVTTTVVPAAPEEACTPLQSSVTEGEKFLHRLEFGSQEVISSRVYRVDFLSCKRAPEDYVITIDRARMSSDEERTRNPESPPPLPVLREPLHLSIFRQTFAHANIANAIRQTIRFNPISFRLNYDYGRSTKSEDWFTIAVEHADNPDTVMFTVSALYDLGTDLITTIESDD